MISALAAEGAHREAAADDLAERGEVGRDAVALLRAAERHAEAGDDLVEDEHDAVRVAQVAQTLQEALGGRHDAHVAGDRLDDDRRDLVAFCGERCRNRVEVVVREHDGVLRRHPW